MAADAREVLSQRLQSADPVGELGGCEQVAVLLSLARTEPGGGGEGSRDGGSGGGGGEAERLVEAAKGKLLAAGAVAAMIIALMYAFAYQEGRALACLHRAASWGPREIADLTSFVADVICVLAASVALVRSLMMYSQLCFWMPSLEAQLWYVASSSSTWWRIDCAIAVAVFCCLLSLGCNCAVTGTEWDLLPFLPLVCALLAALYVHWTLSRDCKDYLDAELAMRTWETGREGAGVKAMVQDARQVLSQGPRSADPVGNLGGCEQTALLLSLARMEPKSGEVAARDAGGARRLVGAAKGKLLTSAVLSALILMLIYGFGCVAVAPSTRHHVRCVTDVCEQVHGGRRAHPPQRHGRRPPPALWHRPPGPWDVCAAGRAARLLRPPPPTWRRGCALLRPRAAVARAVARLISRAPASGNCKRRVGDLGLRLGVLRGRAALQRDARAVWTLRITATGANRRT